ncbi:MAG: hypothetical protein HOB18_00350 [Nitrospina sp.]|jgi:hypothetical protein|nr:hypothetical protein [Nitrospina sp.]
MRFKHKLSVFWGLLSIVAILSACSSTPEPTRTMLGDYEAPEWVLKGAGAFEDSNGKAFYGVGSASGIKNFSLQRTAADDRARNDLAKVFEVWTKSLTKDYMASTTTGDLSVSSEEQNVEVAIKTVTSATLTGVLIIDHWEHPGRNELFSLARLDLISFKNNLDKHKELSKEVREEIKKRADKLHDELEQEVLKKEGKS